MKSPALACVILIANCLLPPRAAHAQNPLVDQGKFPNRVHAFEDFETPIEKRWWLRGIEETKDLPPSLSTLPNTRAFRSRTPRDIDLQKDDKNTVLNAVMFNPVPGPPMGPSTRLTLRYKLMGTDQLRVQLYSLTNGYHRYLALSGLPTGRWELMSGCSAFDPGDRIPLNQVYIASPNRVTAEFYLDFVEVKSADPAFAERGCIDLSERPRLGGR